jgi:hypothetical protein
MKPTTTKSPVYSFQNVVDLFTDTNLDDLVSPRIKEEWYNMAEGGVFAA